MWRINRYYYHKKYKYYLSLFDSHTVVSSLAKNHDKNLASYNNLKKIIFIFIKWIWKQKKVFSQLSNKSETNREAYLNNIL